MESMDIPDGYDDSDRRDSYDSYDRNLSSSEEVALKPDISYAKDSTPMQETPRDLRLIIIPDAPSPSAQQSQTSPEFQVMSSELMIGPQLKLMPGREIVPITDPFKLELRPIPPILTKCLDEKSWYHYLGVYRSNSKIYLERYLCLLSNEPPLHKALAHEQWRYRKQDTITQINDLESWFVDVEEPAPEDDYTETYHLRTDAWRDRILTKLRKHMTEYCPPQIVHLIEKSTSYKIRHDRRIRMRLCLERHSQLNQAID